MNSLFVSDEEKLAYAKKDLKLRFVYFLNKECVPMICDGCDVEEVAEYLRVRLNICFLLDHEYAMIRELHKYLNK